MSLLSKRAALNAIQAELLALASTIANGISNVGGFTFTPAAGGANVSEVTVQALDIDGVAIARPTLLNIWLSDAATGLGLTAVTTSGTVTAKTASGAVFGTLTAKKALTVQTLADGTFILKITDTAKTEFYVAAQSQEGGVPVVSDVLATADYGA